jgi:hypothetical protein
MLDEGKRIYRIYEQNEVQRAEFEYCQLMHQIVFGKDGFVETLGPTWNMIHDPRFIAIENRFIINRHAIFGGDARTGKQYINDDGSFTSTTADLEQYAEIIGEGRNFHNVLVHPNERCPVRVWLERIYKGFSLVKPHLALKCICREEEKQDPTTFKDASEELVWQYILHECPNRGFNRNGQPTPYGTLMHDLIRADMIGLIHDYAETPLIDSYIYLKDNSVITSIEDVQKLDPKGLDHHRVLQEIDILEQALTHRAILRATAFKLLKTLYAVQDTFGRGIEAVGDLTDIERDELLRIIYTSNWPDDKPQLIANLLAFMSRCSRKPLDERMDKQLTDAKIASGAVIDGLKHGTVQPINQYTEPVLEIPDDAGESDVMKYAAMLDSLTQNPLKWQLFSEIYVPAEQEGDVGTCDILSPIFNPNFEVTEPVYFDLLRSITRQARSLRVMEPEAVVPRGTDDASTSPKMNIKEYEEEFHSKDSPYRDAGEIKRAE